MKTKLLLFTLFFAFLFTGKCFLKIKDKADFYLPKEFHGIVFIMYDRGDGIVPEFKNGRKQIIVPQTGIVKLKEIAKFGDIDYKVFLNTNSNIVKELNTYPSFQKNISDSIYVGPGTMVTAMQFSMQLQKEVERYGYTFYVHKTNEIIPVDFSDSWMRDSLLNR